MHGCDDFIPSARVCVQNHLFFAGVHAALMPWDVENSAILAHSKCWRRNALSALPSREAWSMSLRVNHQAQPIHTSETEHRQRHLNKTFRWFLVRDRMQACRSRSAPCASSARQCYFHPSDLGCAGCFFILVSVGTLSHANHKHASYTDCWIMHCEKTGACTWS
jgi:hypothetical protein